MTPDTSTHEIAVKTSARTRTEATPPPETDAEKPSKPPAGDRPAGDTGPVQIQPDGR